MAKFQMNKLVRDAIPSKMRTENQAPIYRIVTGIELQKYLLEKLKEEADEAIAAIDNDKEFTSELADVREVLDTLQQLRHITPAKLAKAKADKRTKRGAFNEGYFIETITLDDTSEWVEYYREQPQRYQEIVFADEDPDQRFNVPELATGIYQHYKGNYYEVLGVGCHTENHEYFVVYKALYKKELNPEIWIRPYNMFIESIERNGEAIPRFTKI
jgi:predicted house-cleaning noncanonical NTP pyrophosphatase (MazG superfamily)